MNISDVLKIVVVIIVMVLCVAGLIHFFKSRAQSSQSNNTTQHSNTTDIDKCSKELIESAKWVPEQKEEHTESMEIKLNEDDTSEEDEQRVRQEDEHEHQENISDTHGQLIQSNDESDVEIASDEHLDEHLDLSNNTVATQVDNLSDNTVATPFHDNTLHDSTPSLTSDVQSTIAESATDMQPYVNHGLSKDEDTSMNDVTTDDIDASQPHTNTPLNEDADQNINTPSDSIPDEPPTSIQQLDSNDSQPTTKDEVKHDEPQAVISSFDTPLII